MLPDRIATDWPPDQWLDVSVLVAVSGGADSVALLLALHELQRDAGGRGELIVGHVDHQLRGAESRDDARWVASLADSLDLNLMTRAANPPGPSLHGESLEGFLRRHRYELLGGMARSAGARYLCTAHHANDQAETVLFRLLRGTGVAGLAGIPSRRVLDDGITLVRPMLGILRGEILQWLNERGQSWRTDSSNASVAPARNRIRLEVLPSLESVAAGDLVAVLGELARDAADIRKITRQMAEDLVTRHFRFLDRRVTVDAGGWESRSSYLWREAFREVWRRQRWPTQAMTRRHWQRLADAAESLHASLSSIKESHAFAAFELPGTLRVSGAAGQLIIEQTHKP